MKWASYAFPGPPLSYPKLFWPGTPRISSRALNILKNTSFSVSIGSSETYLDSSVPIHDDDLQIPKYCSVRVDHPSNTKSGGILIYYKNFLSIKLTDVKYLHESLNFELRIAGKFFVSL